MNKKFTYRALNQKRNKIVKGTIQTTNEYALEQILSESDLILISFKEIKSSFLNFSFLDKITTKDLITFFIHLEQLEKVGVPLLDSLSDLKEYSKNQKIKDMSADMYESVKGGKMLSEAMQKYNKVFDNVMINLIKMGEKTGNLQFAFQNIYKNLKWGMEIKRKTIKAIRYPLFSLFVMIVVAGIMLKVVVPKVTGFIVDQGIDVPVYTEALISTSEFFQKYFFKTIAFGIILLFAIKILSINKNIKYKVDFLKLKVPLIGNIIKKIELSKFTKFFGATFSSGIPILECLSISGDVVKNTALKVDIIRIKEEVSDGKSLSNAMANSQNFTNIVLRMFKIGEESGNMSDSIKNIEYFYSSEINDSIEKIIGSLQPAIIFIMGGLMAWIVAGVFGPIYGNFDNFGA